MGTSKIEWTELTWNPTTGCSKISSGCRNCYAEVMAKRLQAMGLKKYSSGFDVVLHPDALNIPFKWKNPRVIFVNSMSDLFHERIPSSFVQQVFSVMNHCSHHRFQVLTKRAERILELNSILKWTPNIWMGVTIEDQSVLYRMDYLMKSSAKVKFLSHEPLLGPIPDLHLSGIDWVIVGGESGQGSRPIKKEWIHEIRDGCARAKVPFFFKQWGGVNKLRTGRKLDGLIYNEMPLVGDTSLHRFDL